MAIYKIGRGEGNHIVLGDKSVSRSHAELEELGAGRFRLKDLGSSSGTQMLSGSDWVDVKEAEVRHDTKIRFGEYETTPMDLVRDQDKTMVQARATPAAAEAPRPAAPKPAPPKPAPPKPAPPRAAAPRPTPPSPPQPAAQRPARAPGAGMDKQTMWILVGGGGALLLLVLIAVIVVLVTGGEQQSTEVRPPARTETPAAPTTPTTPTTPTPPAQPTPPRTETPTPPAQPTPPRTETPPTQGGMQRMTQACRTSWQGSEAVCQCVMRAVQPVLQEGDYDDAIEVMTMVFTNKSDEARQKVQQMVAQGGQEKAQRIVSAVQAIGRDCKSVQ
jgi:outer membrane biosynthesis protein TonB